MKPVLDVVLDANVVFLVAFGFWALTQAIIARSQLRTDYALQLRLLRILLAVVILSPLLSFALVTASQSLWPRAPITASDLAVAAYLRGDIAMSAVTFEELLHSRTRIVDGVLAGDLPWLSAILAALLAGGAYLALRTARNVLHVRHAVASSYVWRRTRSTDIRLSDTAEVPFAARGLFRRHVVLPSRLVTRPRELRIVLAHEFEHLRQGDVEWELAFEFLRPLLYWNPVFMVWKRAFDRLRELNCDREALRALGVTPREYAECLLAFCAPARAARPIDRMNVAFVRTGTSGARRALETRVLALRDSHEVHWIRGTVLMTTGTALAIAVILAAASVRSPNDWTPDRLMLSTVVNLERLERINAGF